MNRRRFMQRGLFGGAVLLLGGGGLSLYPTRHVASPTRPLRVLDDRGFQVIAAVAARVITAPDADPGVLAQRIDDSLSRLPPESQHDLAGLVGLFENALPGLLLDARATPFTRLDAASQDRALESWRDSRLVVRRSGYHALRRLCFVAYYGDESAWPGIHYQGPPDVKGFSHDDSKAGTPEWIAAQDRAGAP